MTSHSEPSVSSLVKRTEESASPSGKQASESIEGYHSLKGQGGQEQAGSSPSTNKVQCQLCRCDMITQVQNEGFCCCGHAFECHTKRTKLSEREKGIIANAERDIDIFERKVKALQELIAESRKRKEEASLV